MAWKFLSAVFLLLSALVDAGAATLCKACTENSASIDNSSWTFFKGATGKPEGPGWRVYYPLVQWTIESNAKYSEPDFANKLSAFQRLNGMADLGVLGKQTAVLLKSKWQSARSHMHRVRSGKCIVSRSNNLDVIQAVDLWDNSRKRRVDPTTYKKYVEMRNAFLREVGDRGNSSPDALKIVSAWRSPEYDINICKHQVCNGTNKTSKCSAHWSGLALDLHVGALSGYSPTDSTYKNRLFQSKTVEYQWLVANASRFGFVNYAFEPWHWEYNP